MAILIDANIFLSYGNKNDVHHTQATSLMKIISSKRYGDMYTTDHIFDEVVSVALRKFGKENAVKLGLLLRESGIFLLSVLPSTLNAAWILFQEDHSLNFTDCTTVAIVRELGILHVATFDQEFKKFDGIHVIED